MGSTGRSKLENSMKIKSEKDYPLNEVQKEIKMQDLKIDDLTKQIQELEE